MDKINKYLDDLQNYIDAMNEEKTEINNFISTKNFNDLFENYNEMIGLDNDDLEDIIKMKTNNYLKNLDEYIKAINDEKIEINEYISRENFDDLFENYNEMIGLTDEDKNKLKEKEPKKDTAKFKKYFKKDDKCIFEEIDVLDSTAWVDIKRLPNITVDLEKNKQIKLSDSLKRKKLPTKINIYVEKGGSSDKITFAEYQLNDDKTNYNYTNKNIEF